jgi:DNA-binding beta-propeller fold protein YncE
MKNIHKAAIGAALAIAATLTTGCNDASPSPEPAPGSGCVATMNVTPAAASGDLRNRAYVASRDSGNITVIDLDSLEIVATLDTCGRGYHMVELSADFAKMYATDTENNELDVLDARDLKLTQQVAIGSHPTHLSLSRNGKMLAVMDEGDNAISFVDVERQVEVKRLSGFYTPHFMRFAPDGKYGYVANLGAHHITRVDLATLEIDGHVALDGFEGPPNVTEAPDEGGFADAQIDANGVLWAAHAQTGRVLAYDVNAKKKLPDVAVGLRPWIVYAEHPFANVEARAVPNHGDKNLSLLGRLATSSAPSTAMATVMTGEPESFGVNYSSLVPEKAFVMNRLRKEIAVVNTTTKLREAVIDVGGNTETASTTADGRFIIAAVSSANRVVVIDAKTNGIVKAFDNVGNYPWTVTIPRGQNYCH